MIIPLYGHDAIRARLAAQQDRAALPASLLFHGPAGIGKQRLALWLAQRLLCENPDRPCGGCQHCRFVPALQHPDVHWVFPHESVTGSADWPFEDLKELQQTRIAERAEAKGLYARPDGSCGIYKADTRYLRHVASMSPAMGKRKILIIGDAERMVSQAASQEAANMFLKLLEEPPSDTNIILTSSEPNSLLPTIRSRVVMLRVPPLPEETVRAFIADPLAAESLPKLPASELLRLASGAPGQLLGGDDREAAMKRARALLTAADGTLEQRFRAAFTAGSAKARGAFSETLDALTVVAHERVREAADRGDAVTARRVARVVPFIEEAKRAAEGNGNPQVITAQLLEHIASIPR